LCKSGYFWLSLLIAQFKMEVGRPWGSIQP
jgi:hypothetical protein